MNLNKYAQFIRYLAEEPAAQDGGQPPAEGEAPSGETNTDTNVEDNGEGGDGPSDGEGGESGEGDEVSVDFAKLELPEGVELDQAAVDAFGPLMNGAKFTQEQAQEFATAFAEFRQAEAQKQSEAFSNQLENWAKESESDKEFGGDKFEQSAKLAVQAVEKFGTPELKQLMDDTGLGNNPEVVRFMYRVGKAIQEDNPGSGGNGPTEKRDRVSVLYPNS